MSPEITSLVFDLPKSTERGTVRRALACVAGDICEISNTNESAATFRKNAMAAFEKELRWKRQRVAASARN